MRKSVFIAAAAGFCVALLQAQSAGRSYPPGREWWVANSPGLFPFAEEYDNADGMVTVLNSVGPVIHAEEHPFFQTLGTNKRACVTCHQPVNGMSVGTMRLEERWKMTEGRDPVFDADGLNCPDQPRDAKSSHSLLLERGLFRIPLAWPPKTADGAAIHPDFSIEIVNDPTGCNRSAKYGMPAGFVNVYRRSRVAANLKHVINGPSGVVLMADGREPSLKDQAMNAILGHMEAQKVPAADLLQQIVDFESQLYVAQVAHPRAGMLDEKGGPSILGTEVLASERSVSLAGDMNSPAHMTFAVWKKPAGAGDLGIQKEFRASVARGADLFFGHRFDLNGAGGLKSGTCASCHTAGTTRWMNIGTEIVDAPEQAAKDLPLFRITCDSGSVVYTYDPGRAMISGKCADAGAIVQQQFRGLSAHAPYFANGSAKTLEDVVEHYNRRFHAGFTESEKKDLANFLRVL